MNRINTYDVFEGEDLKVAELIQQRRLQVLVHSCIYYKFNHNVVSDMQFDKWAKELASLQKQYPEISDKVMYSDEFKGFDGSTGFDLPIEDEWVVEKAKKFVPYKIIKSVEPKVDSKGKFKLF